jgi:hypothetical protein
MTTRNIQKYRNCTLFPEYAEMGADGEWLDEQAFSCWEIYRCDFSSDCKPGVECDCFIDGDVPEATATTLAEAKRIVDKMWRDDRGARWALSIIR